MSPFTDHYPGGFRRQHPYGNLQPLPSPVNNRHRALSSLRSAKDLNGSTAERVKRIEDLDFSVFCTQGTVGVGVFIPMFTVSSLPVACRWITPTGFHPALASFFPARCCVACFVASSWPVSSPPSNTISSTSRVIWHRSLSPRSSLPGCDRYSARTGWSTANHPSVAPSMYSSILA